MVIATKGDLLDQQRKLNNSSLEKYFEHIEIISDKTENDYYTLMKRLGIKTEDFKMIGNSLKSDILPVVEIGGQAVHIPYHTTGEHEKVKVSDKVKSSYVEIGNISEIVRIIEEYN